LFDFGYHDSNPFIVFEQLGPSLESIKDSFRGTLCLRDVLMIAMQAIECLRFFHSCHFIHRDIKAENFLVGLGDKSRILYIIDYGLAKQYRDPRTKHHISLKTNKSLTGTPRFASINNHRGYEQSRRDDLESLAYVLIYLLKG
jgi:serine/threonine protein kinase